MAGSSMEPWKMPPRCAAVPDTQRSVASPAAPRLRNVRIATSLAQPSPDLENGANRREDDATVEHRVAGDVDARIVGPENAEGLSAENQDDASDEQWHHRVALSRRTP